MWKSLQHPNILPLIGVVMSETRFELVSAWMENGNINEFIEAHPNTDRLELVSPPVCDSASLDLVTIRNPLADRHR